MPIELLGAAAAVLLVLAIRRLRGGYETRRAVSVIAVVVLALVTVAVVLSRGPAGQQNATPGSASLPSSAPSATPPPVSASDDPAPSGAGTVVRHEVSLPPGTYSLFVVDGEGTVTSERGISFDEASMAPVDRVESPNGLIHWRTVVGGAAGWSYIAGRSGPFTVREVVRLADGSTESRDIDPGS